MVGAMEKVKKYGKDELYLSHIHQTPHHTQLPYIHMYIPTPIHTYIHTAITFNYIYRLVNVVRVSFST